jgi:VanZ family protein
VTLSARVLSRLDPWLPPVALMGVIFFLSAQPDLSSGLGVFDTIGRKIVHAGEFALLAFLWWRALRTVAPPARAALGAFCLAVAYAATDEYHQTFVEGRSGNAVDVLIDAAGAGAGALLAGRRR